MTGLWVWWETVKEWFVSSPEPKLTIELVPKGQWGTNLRSRLPKAEWDRLRKAQYQAAGYVCEICGGEGPSHPVETTGFFDSEGNRAYQDMSPPSPWTSMSSMSMEMPTIRPGSSRLGRLASGPLQCSSSHGVNTTSTTE